MDRDNQQQTVSDMEIGWLAGFLEGEGSVCLQVHRRAGRENRIGTIRVTPKVIFTNTDAKIIETAARILQGLGVGRYVCHTPARGSALAPKASRPVTYIHISGMERVKALLDVMAPCLFGEKRERAVRLLAFINRRLEQAAHYGVKSNFRYDAEDARLILDFVANSQSKQYDHISRMLNEHTRSAPHSVRAMMCSDLTGNSKRPGESTARHLTGGQ